FYFFFSSRRRHTRSKRDWSSDVCSSDLVNANKKVILGIETVATLMKSEMFFVDYDNTPRFRQEIYNYIWHKTKDEPKQEFDDVQDSIRYGILSDKTLANRTPKKEKYKALKSLGL